MFLSEAPPKASEMRVRGGGYIYEYLHGYLTEPSSGPVDMGWFA